ncbi:MAG: hypothetical protein WDZ53_11035 [Balneolales bacterium]
MFITLCWSFPQKAEAQENQAVSQDKNVGIGVAIGDYTGFSYKFRFTPQYAINGAVTAIISENNSQLYAHWDFLIHRSDFVEVGDGDLDLFYGFGFFVEFNELFDNGSGLRVPVGIEYMLENRELGVFIEAAPTARITTASELRFRGAIGFRYYL